MTGPADNADRERILTSHRETLFVEAGAGTGKTTSLVARVVHMVATGHLGQIGELAAITFTENAAAELRSRIREGLEGACRGEHLLQLLDDSLRAGVWPDSVQVIGGQLSMRLPTGCTGVAHHRSAARRSP